MNRGVLFRAKTKDTQWWVEGYYAIESNHACYENELKHTHFIFKDEFMDWGIGGLVQYEVIPETVGQYTGLRDCKRTEEYPKGQMIFEGDIVKGLFLHMLPINAVVVFKDGAFGLEWYRGDIKTFNAFTSICNVEYEVIGNIHDNPELLQGT